MPIVLNKRFLNGIANSTVLNGMLQFEKNENITIVAIAKKVLRKTGVNNEGFKNKISFNSLNYKLDEIPIGLKGVVNSLIRLCALIVNYASKYNNIKSIKNNIPFGINGSSNNLKNKNENFQNLQKALINFKTRINKNINNYQKNIDESLVKLLKASIVNVPSKRDFSHMLKLLIVSVHYLIITENTKRNEAKNNKEGNNEQKTEKNEGRKKIVTQIRNLVSNMNNVLVARGNSSPLTGPNNNPNNNKSNNSKAIVVSKNNTTGANNNPNNNKSNNSKAIVVSNNNTTGANNPNNNKSNNSKAIVVYNPNNKKANNSKAIVVSKNNTTGSNNNPIIGKNNNYGPELNSYPLNNNSNNSNNNNNNNIVDPSKMDKLN